MRATADVKQVLPVNRGPGFALSVETGTMAAALGANSVVFAMRAPATGAVSVVVDRLHMAYTTIVAYTTPISPGRRLGVFRATNPGVEISGGADVHASIRQKDAAGVASSVAVASIATTAALTAGGLVLDAAPLAMMDLVSSGTAGARLEQIYELAAPKTEEWLFNPGEYIVISNPQAMDAAGTWQLAINELSWYEQARLAVAF